jgi:hypothetical protein
MVFIESLTSVSPGGGPVVQTVTQANPSGLEGPGTLVLVATNADGTPFLLPPTGASGPSRCDQHGADDAEDQGCNGQHRCDDHDGGHGHHHGDDVNDDCGSDD